MQEALLQPTPSSETRQRLLDAAGEVFAEVGFRAATIREICQRANANVAAVNYHFGDKERLYWAVLAYAQHSAIAKYPMDMGLEPGATPEQRLRAVVRSMLFRLFGEGAPAWRGQLISREMFDPTGALDRLVAEEIRPRSDMVRDVVRDLLGPAASEELVRRCALSIGGQTQFYHHARPLITRLHPEETYTPEEIERIADHITEFTLAALRGLSGAAAAP